MVIKLVGIDYPAITLVKWGTYLISTSCPSPHLLNFLSPSLLYNMEQTRGFLINLQLFFLFILKKNYKMLKFNCWNLYILVLVVSKFMPHLLKFSVSFLSFFYSIILAKGKIPLIDFFILNKLIWIHHEWLLLDFLLFFSQYLHVFIFLIFNWCPSYSFFFLIKFRAWCKHRPQCLRFYIVEENFHQ